MHDAIMNCFAGTKAGLAFGIFLAIAYLVAYTFFRDEILEFEKTMPERWYQFKRRFWKQVNRRAYQWKRARQMAGRAKK